MRLADGREVTIDAMVLGVEYNVYDCPGDGAEERIEHGPNGATYVPAVPQHALLSMDVDKGVTPMFVTCPDHGKRASSRFYHVDDPTKYLPVRMVWRRATKGEMKRARQSNVDLLIHYEQGGLEREWT